MLGDIEKKVDDNLKLEKQEQDLKNQVLKLISQQDKCREICHEVYQKYGKLIKIRTIYAKPKGLKNEYYQITIEKED